MERGRTAAWAAMAVWLIFSPAAALADDDCFTGASLLADQRAVAAARAAVEKSCPCASFPHRLRDRQAYQRCARAAIQASARAGDLRSPCLRTVYDAAFLSTCGTERIACGEFDSAADEPVDCRLSSREQCRDRGLRAEKACALQSCSDVVDWSAGTCVDVRQRGPFNAGVKIIRMVKKSVVDPTADRVLDVVVWYPALPGGTVNGGYRAVVDAPFDDSMAPYPLLMFSHGSCGAPTQSLFLTPLLASYGFIVVAPPHPGNTIREFPNCGLPATQVDSARERPQDVLFALDEMLAMNGDSTSAFFGMIDPDRLGTSGHSFGGYTTYLTAGLDARFKVAMPLAPAVPGTPMLRVPSLEMMSQLDTYVNNPKIRQAYADAAAPKLLVEVLNAGHFAYSDLCFPSPDCNPPTTLTQAEANSEVLRWTLPFLEVYLAGDESFRPFFSAVPPGVVMEKDLGSE